MKREIKFRLFRVHDGDMLCPVNPVWFEENNWRHDDFAKCAEEENCVLMQFTGLLDKNGKEIYQGDIILYWGDRCEVIWQHHAAQWILQSFSEGRGYRQMSYDYAQKDFEIIGNIHEHPELL